MSFPSDNVGRLCSRSKTRRANNNGNKACSPDGVITFSFREISERKASVVGKKMESSVLDLKRNTNGMFLVSTGLFPDLFRSEGIRIAVCFNRKFARFDGFN